LYQHPISRISTLPPNFMKQFFFLLLLGIILLPSCKKVNDPELDPDPNTCVSTMSNTLTLLYPCDGAVGVIPDSFSWAFGSVGTTLAGFVELNINKVEPPAGLYSSYHWSGFDEARTKGSVDAAQFPLLANTTYEWYMALRHDGNGLQFKTPKQTFTTGNTGYQLPVIHQSFAGKFLVQDSITGREKVYESLNTWHYVDLVPSSNGTKTVTLETISGAIIYTYNSDTLTTMRLRIGSTDNVVVNMNHKGSFYWSDNNYYTPTSIAGRVMGDSIAFSKTRYNYNEPTYSGHKYTGVRTH